MAKKYSADKDNDPYLSAAFIVEKVLREDKVVSAIRIVDQITVPPDSCDNGDTLGTNLTILVMFKAGNYRGKKTLYLDLVQPLEKSKKRIREQELDFSQDGAGLPEAGVNILMPLLIVWDGPGPYRYDVYLGDALVARVPFRVHLAEGTAKSAVPVEKKVDSERRGKGK